MDAALAAGVDPMMEGVDRLIVFDYDWSLINCNSDEVVLDLHPALHEEMRELRRQGEQWTQLVDRMMTRLAEVGVARSDILAHIADVPVQEGMLEAVRFAHQQPNTRLAIVSDANHVFISAMLEKHCLGDVFCEVFTNEGHWEAHTSSSTTTRGGERLRVSAFHQGVPHECPLCPVNMCKGRILQQLLVTHRPRQVVYIGDGGGDFCPCSRLTSADVIFARAADEGEDGKTYALLQKLMKMVDENRLAASLQPWKTGHDIREGFLRVFNY